GRQQVLLGVKPVCALQRIIHGKKDVVDVDGDPAPEPGKNLKKENGDVRIHKRPVRAVDEEDVASAEIVDEGEVGTLQRLANGFVTDRIDFGAGMRIDRQYASCQV